MIVRRLRSASALLGAVVVLMAFAAHPARADDPTPAPRATIVSSGVDAFGFPTRPYTVEDIDIDEEAPTADALEAVGLAPDAAGRLADWAERDLGIAAFAPGRLLHVYREGATLSHVVYEEDADSYVVLKPGVLPIVRRLSHPAAFVERAEVMTLTGSIGLTVRRAGLSAAVADSMRAAFGRRLRIDGLGRGSVVSVVMEEERVGGVVLATRIKAVRIATPSGKIHEAFRVDRDSVSGFFDGNGISLGDLFLSSPLEDGQLTSRYSLARLHPVDSVWRPHFGTDFAAPMGTPVHSVGDGVVVEAGYTGGNGNYVKVRHDATYTTGYLHFSRIDPAIRAGVRVRKGQVFGYVGMTGLATGPHVCYRYWRNGVQIDPLVALMPPGPPLSADLKTAFEAERDRLRSLFEAPTAADRVLEPLVLPRADLVPTLVALGA